jgi:hypothetical protein
VGLNDTAKNIALDAVTAAAVFMSLHTADPGQTGLNEVTGGSPAYIRKAVTWNPASTGTVDNSNIPVFDVPAGTVAFVGLWSSATAGIFYGSAAVTAEVYAGQGTYTVDDGDITLT